MNASQNLKDLRVALLVAEGFEEIELTSPRQALAAAGARTDIVSPRPKRVDSFVHHDRGHPFDVDVELDDARPDAYDALVLPGGVMNPDQLRMIPTAVDFVRRFFTDRKPVAAICHAPWTLIEADVVRGRTLTSWPSLQTDLRNAGAVWVDREVVEDGNLVTSRKPDDLPAFNRKMIALFARATANSAT